jgi:hypothetical protein
MYVLQLPHLLQYFQQIVVYQFNHMLLSRTSQSQEWSSPHPCVAFCVCVQVLSDLGSVDVMLASQLQQLSLLQSPGACVLQGPDKLAEETLQELLYLKLAIVIEEMTAAQDAWKAAAGQLVKRMAARAEAETSGGEVSWGHELQQLLRGAMPEKTAADLRDIGAAVCVEFPVKLCCNNPGCTSMAKVGEMLLGSSCSGCKAARYCSKACQGAAWKMGHSKVCKRITKAAAAVSPGGA